MDRERAMTESHRCPMCGEAELRCREGRLEQSGNTHLPTTIWSCSACGWARWEPARGVAWRADAQAPLRAVA